MAFYKFWQNQPVPQFDDSRRYDEGPIKLYDPEEVSSVPGPLADGYEWSSLDVDIPDQQHELYDLLAGHYVEDDYGSFRFAYSIPFLMWALKPPGWKRDWHVCVRNTETKTLVAFLAAVPAIISVRGRRLQVAQIDFLCIHRELRSRRLAPALIQEVTRRCALDGLQHAVYTSGTVLPRPVSSCRYFHRPLNWEKLYDFGFSPLPGGSTVATEIANYSFPDDAQPLSNMRLMTADDAVAVCDLLQRYVLRFDLIPIFDVEEVKHWFLQGTEPLDDEQHRVVRTYVVEDPETGEIADMLSFSTLESIYLQDGKPVGTIKAAYLYYYATVSAFSEVNENLVERLTELIESALVIAKRTHHDVFNALTLQDNTLFIDKLKFRPGDGDLNYYLFNYRATPIPGDIRQLSTSSRRRGGVGLVLL
ncbi:acyl-CoA N-acyltransferase [Aspergillus stella-maris]|uniref:acyl-CoA N-acyltransferase n=1 Tax=Aspergillus stella-maris TaxID=1810926 RepID=UPI003CCDEEEB